MWLKMRKVLFVAINESKDNESSVTQTYSPNSWRMRWKAGVLIGNIDIPSYQAPEVGWPLWTKKHTEAYRIIFAGSQMRQESDKKQMK